MFSISSGENPFPYKNFACSMDSKENVLQQKNNHSSIRKVEVARDPILGQIIQSR